MRENALLAVIYTNIDLTEQLTTSSQYLLHQYVWNEPLELKIRNFQPGQHKTFQSETTGSISSQCCPT